MRNQQDEEVLETVVQISKMQVFIYLFVMPLLFTLLLIVVLGSALSVFDFSPQLYDAQMWMHNLPLVGAWIPEPALPESEETALEQMRRELLEGWDDLFDERALLHAMAEEIAFKERNLNEALMLFTQEQALRLNRDQRIQFLVSTFETMRPAEAAAIFDVLDDESCVELLLNMEIAIVARILPNMNVEKAGRLGQMIRR